MGPGEDEAQRIHDAKMARLAQEQTDKEALIEQRDKAYRELDAMKLQLHEAGTLAGDLLLIVQPQTQRQTALEAIAIFRQKLYELSVAGNQKGFAVGQQVAPGLIVVHEDTLAQMSQSLTMIHDLAGQLGNHPHAGAIQAWVHKVMPCGRKCPHSGVFRGEKCGKCGEEVR